MDRGFELMIPRPKEVKKENYVVNYGLKFTLFGREFNLSFNVKHIQESP